MNENNTFTFKFTCDTAGVNVSFIILTDNIGNFVLSKLDVDYFLCATAR